ncbi:MAG: zinc ABC transporter ATP-binding protein ZnuC [Porticoccaceae bacterium]|nr:zinc ABC transporter ATP-binding protein ZnuC [Porticoccaceae bacterium]
MQTLLQANNICLRIGDHEILDKVSFQLQANQIITLIGPNGAGKTSLIRILLGLQKATSGSVTLATNIRIGYMPQKLAIDLSLPLSVHGFLRLADTNSRHAVAALEQVGVPHLLNSPMAHLSGGETQRVLLARALLRKPQLLVLDEPVQGVDVNGQEALYKLISQIRDTSGCGILMISHDLHLVMASTDEVLCLNRHLCCQGTPEVVSANPIYTELFGVRTAFYTHHHDHEHDLHGAVDNREEDRHQDCHHG